MNDQIKHCLNQLMIMSRGVSSFRVMELGSKRHLFLSIIEIFPEAGNHTGQCKRTGGCYNELVVAFFSTGGGVKGKKIYTC